MNHFLSDQSLTNQQPDSPPTFSGAILGLQGDVLHGWAMDNVHQEERLIIEVYIDGVSVAVARADRYEPGAQGGDQYHGFVVQLSQNWLNDARLITARIANQPIALEGQILLPASLSQDTAEITSQIWHTGGLRVGGWCWDPKAPHRHVQIIIRKGDHVIAKAVCNAHNQALAYRATSDHGFSIDLPWELADGETHELEILNDLGQPLNGSPIRLRCYPEGIEGLLKTADVKHDAAAMGLLIGLAKEYTLRLPRSVGWQHYPKWFETFQRLEKLSSPVLQGKLGLLLISNGNQDQENISLASLGKEREHVHALAIAPFENVLPGIESLLMQGCDRILPLMAGDHLALGALPHFSELLNNDAAWAYADCDRDGPEGDRGSPWLKPVWDLDLFIGADVFMPGAIFGSEIITKALELISTHYKRSTINWHDLTAGIALATHKNKAIVVHLPRVLYHQSNEAPISPEQQTTSTLRFQAIEWLCKTLEPKATVNPVTNYPSLLEVHWPLPEKLPTVTLLVPTRDQYKLLKTCVEGLLNRTDYPNLEIIVIDNQSSDPNTLAYFEDIKHRGVVILEHPYPFNYSSINNRAAKIASGEIIGLVNNDIEIIESGWLKEMVAQLIRPGVGAVGAKLLWPNQMVQHNGVVVGINSLAAHTGNNLQDNDPGYLGLNQLTRQQSAVTAACLITHKSLYESVGGLDEKMFPVAFNDVDLCMKIRAAGFSILVCASAKLIHAESASRGKDLTREKQARAMREQMGFIQKWTLSLCDDPFYHPALSLDYVTGPYGGLALPTPIPKARTNQGHGLI
ncbi:glycosyltransferase family 2 protein [Pseudomonas entomophila]|uniref:glycosyltransferase family 2 protein n=1 Tax=Pseudomonas entomophila TaxID=312306 RepID=UPI0015E2E27F|nr:glycosyltransferase family 2 protein [Pseudomonas entomophila]MBA1193703.1 glycosyltransferase family 2 protein [Pseudomonas entomophila]